MLGKQSYAEVAMQGRLFDTPDKALRMLDQMEQSLARDSGGRARRPPMPQVTLTLAQVVSAIRRVMRDTFGADLVLVTGNEWAPNVWELAVEKEGSTLGYVYLVMGNERREREREGISRGVAQTSFRIRLCVLASRTCCLPRSCWSSTWAAVWSRQRTAARWCVICVM